MFMVRALTRYWFIAPLFLAIIGLQMGVSQITTTPEGGSAQNSAAVSFIVVTGTVDDPLLHETVTRTPRPTFTSTPSPTSTPTFTPSPTRTATPTKTSQPTPAPSASPTSEPTRAPTATLTPTPQPTPTEVGLHLTVPILMYHYLSTPPADADAIRQDLSVSPDQFESHLAYLRQAGYETISFQQLIFALSQQAELPPKPIIITFDDGYRDQYENAFPLLRQYGYIATFFIFNQPIDTYNISYLTWEMVIEMHKAGMEFGSHSYDHPNLSGKDVDFLVYQILGSKEALEERIGEPVRIFSYPSGRYDALTIKVLESANFWGAVTTQPGARQSYGRRFELPRVRINGNDSAANLADKLSYFR